MRAAGVWFPLPLFSQPSGVFFCDATSQRGLDDQPAKAFFSSFSIMSVVEREPSGSLCCAFVTVAVADRDVRTPWIFKKSASFPHLAQSGAESAPGRLLLLKLEFRNNSLVLRDGDADRMRQEGFQGKCQVKLSKRRVE